MPCHAACEARSSRSMKRRAALVQWITWRLSCALMDAWRSATAAARVRLEGDGGLAVRQLEGGRCRRATLERLADLAAPRRIRQREHERHAVGGVLRGPDDVLRLPGKVIGQPFDDPLGHPPPEHLRYERGQTGEHARRVTRDDRPVHDPEAAPVAG